MKAYGNSRRDNLTCEYGCCTTKKVVAKGSRAKVAKAIVHRGRAQARQEGRQQAQAED